MKALPFSLDHLLNDHSIEEVVGTLADYAIEVSLNDEEDKDARFKALVNAHTALVISKLQCDESGEEPFLDPKEAAAYAAKLVFEYTGSYEESIDQEFPVIHKALVKRLVIAHLNRMRVSMEQLKRMHERKVA